MDSLRRTVSALKKTEQTLLNGRIANQHTYISYSRVLVIIAAIISILISLVSYFRIKGDLDTRLAKQREDQRLYEETSDRIAQMEVVTDLIAQGSYTTRSQDLAEDELGRIGKALNHMGEHLQANFEELRKRAWLQEGAVQISDAMRGERNVRTLSVRLLNCLTQYIDTPVATMYITNQHSLYALTAAHAVNNAPELLHPGEGLTGQALLDQRLRVIADLPSDYLPIGSSTGQAQPVSVILFPLVYEGSTLGVIEIGMLREPEPHIIELLNNVMEMISIAVNAALDHQTLQSLLEETQAQSEELQAQHSELENLNSELEAQALHLQASEEELKVQQEELQQTNAELEERTVLLEEKNNEIHKKAEELALTTRYKSEFMANMSHELRTPLNSILLLSRLLADNPTNTLNSDQVEYARVIQSSGNGLLWLIDEILDLSKIEAGKMDLDFEPVHLKEVLNDLHALFRPMAAEKAIALQMTMGDAPETIQTDRHRLDQVLKNLLSNAIKFTGEGSVSLSVQTCRDNARFVCFSVKDTGVGIPEDKQQLVFQAFQQADGSTRRKYGGTGLGLSISRELAKLLGGEIRLSSEPGTGSDFTVYIPIEHFPDSAREVSTDHPDGPDDGAAPVSPNDPFVAGSIPDGIPDDRDTIQSGDQAMLIVEDDVPFAKSVLAFTRKNGYKGIVCVRGDEALPLALQYAPKGILLDIELPVMSGWEVMDALKGNPQTRHIPVHMMSSHKMRVHGLQKGAVDFMEKPVSPDQLHEVFRKIEQVLTRNPKKVLILEDNAKHAEALAYYLDTHNIHSEVKQNVAESIAALQHNHIDCVVLDMGIPASQSYELLETVKQHEGFENLPIIIFTGSSLSIQEEQRIRRYADAIVVKTAHSYQRMLDEVSLFLHLVGEQGISQPATHKRFHALNEVLNHRTVLIADDDIRNIFSLTKALEGLKMNVVTATDGKDALKKLQEHPEIGIVLLDMMMPEMDGYETARRIREQEAYADLPVIAVTAKAMMGDREKCVAAGASDYITKPVDIDQLLSLLRVWLYNNQ
jgi:signal transduction histidine kinase/DNA-binding response OmpR family regulator